VKLGEREVQLYVLYEWKPGCMRTFAWNIIPRGMKNMFATTRGEQSWA
jgi:hypothetical protein